MNATAVKAGGSSGLRPDGGGRRPGVFPRKTAAESSGQVGPEPAYDAVIPFMSG